MAKTIKEIAEEIGVSKPAIHQKRKKEPLKSSLQPFTETVNNTVYISEEGVKLIKQAFLATVETQEVETVSVNLSETINSVVYTLQGELEAKNKQIEAQQKTISELTATLLKTSETLQASQALHAGTIQTQLEAQSQNTSSDPTEAPSEGESATEDTGGRAEEKSSSKGFWGRFFQK